MKITIVSGYFNSINEGHENVLKAAKKMGDKLIVIVNNNVQMEKKGILEGKKAKDRIKEIKKLGLADEVVLSIDEDGSVKNTLKKIAQENKGNKLVFCNGGERENSLDIPETEVCRENDIALKFSMGEKMDTGELEDILC